MKKHLGYFRRRASDERGAAKTAKHPAARRAHVEMAQRYENLVKAIASGIRIIRF